jgi:hypothetical protein
MAVAVASLLLSLLAVEAASRLSGFDFERKAQAFKRTPIFYRMPTEPVGEVYFRRPGPDLWKGNVLAEGYRNDLGGKSQTYAGLPEVTVSYDGQGFRNPPELTDWEIVVVGDSFTELGYLPYEDLFTTRLGKLLNQRVKNLGASYTGTLAQSFYLKEYGKSQSTERAILVFYEGNDLTDIERESQSLRTFKATGQRPYRDIQRPSSFLESLYAFGRRFYGRLRVKMRPNNNVAFFSSQSGEVPVTLDNLPPGRSELSSAQVAQLDEAFSLYAETARRLNLKPWLVYMPCKRRALEGRLKFTEGTDEKYVNWRPTDLPELVKELCGKNGIDFIDVTRALAGKTQDGILTYNPIWDTHLNREGSEAVAQAIADALRQE